MSSTARRSSRKRAASPVAEKASKATASASSSSSASAAFKLAKVVSSSLLPSPEEYANLTRIPKGSTGLVFAMGSGDCSQLGLGADDNMRERKKPTLLKEGVAGKNIVAIAAGSLHNLVLDNKHAVYSWGCNDDFALGRDTDEWLAEPVNGPLGKGASNVLPGGVVQIACGASHSIALTAQGEVYSWGTYRDANGVIGFSDTQENAVVPQLLTAMTEKKVKVVQIAAGEHHDVLLTENGEVYQWGDIGIGRRFSNRHKKNKLSPTRVIFKRVEGVAPPKKIHAVFAGGHSNFALDEKGVAWFWGPNNYNQGGKKNEDKKELMVHIPTPLLDLPPLSKVACAVHHSLFLTREGDVYSVGRGEDGRLGHGDGKNYELPKRIEMFSHLPEGDKVVDVNCGECHSMVVTQQGRLYTFGYGDLLQLGNGVEEDVMEPYLVKSQQLDDAGAKGLGRHVVQAAGGAQHSILLAYDRTKPAPGSQPKEKTDAAAAAPAAADVAAAAADSAAAPAASS